LVEAGLRTICIETRHVKAAFKTMTVKTDENDARGMAQLLRLARISHGRRCIGPENLE
jgi:hypothetical protein